MRRLGLFASCLALGCAMSQPIFSHTYTKSRKVSEWNNHAEDVKNKVLNSQPVSRITTERTALFIFDLDDTIVEGNYKGEQRFQCVKLKPGVADTMRNILEHGHHIGIATYNVREVEDFLMKELGFSWRNFEARKDFANKVIIEQPSIAERDFFIDTHIPSCRDGEEPLIQREYRGGKAKKIIEGLSEVFKNSKGDMVEKIIHRVHSKNEQIDLIVFSDDKIRFHKQVLSRAYYNKESKQIPLMGLVVGSRNASEQNQDNIAHPSFYTNHLFFVSKLANNYYLMNQFIDAIGAKPVLFSPQQIDQIILM